MIDNEHVSDVFCTLGPELVAPESANKSRGGASMAADSCQLGQVCGGAVCGGVLERLEGLVLLEALRQMLGALRTETVVEEAANESRVGVLVATDSCQIGQVCGRWAYPTVVRVVFVLSASDRCFAPVGPMSLRPRLRTRAEWDC